jgi:4-hydroxybenzoate polyprenyltransferase
LNEETSITSGKIGLAQQLRATIRLLRPIQWSKNIFLFAPLVFSRHLFEEGYFFKESIAFVVFCVLSSSVYVFNDIADREADRLHPIKKKRPLADGTISVQQGFVVGLVLVVGAVFLSGQFGPKFQAAAGLYFVMNIAYSFWLKQMILVDVFLIAAGFMIRVLAGAFAIDVVVSHWLVLCTLFVSLFLAVSKRRGEILLVHSNTGSVGRPVLKEYDIVLIDQIITITAAGMAISYALYTVADRTVAVFGTEHLIFTTVFVLFGIFRYLIVMRKNKTEDNPTLLLLRDPVMILNIIAWFGACIIVIYFNDIKDWI